MSKEEKWFQLIKGKKPHIQVVKAESQDGKGNYQMNSMWELHSFKNGIVLMWKGTGEPKDVFPSMEEAAVWLIENFGEYRKGP